MSLLSHFCRRIRLTGPISVGALMQDVIMDPKHGYYPQVRHYCFVCFFDWECTFSRNVDCFFIDVSIHDYLWYNGCNYWNIL